MTLSRFYEASGVGLQASARPTAAVFGLKPEVGGLAEARLKPRAQSLEPRAFFYACTNLVPLAPQIGHVSGG